jgi:hypothetical protein
MLILGSGVLFATIGAVLLVVGEPLIGAIFVAVGVSDAVIALIFRRQAEGRKPSAAPAQAQEPAETDPSHNPYARED